MYVIWACYCGKEELHSISAGNEVKDQHHQNSLVLTSSIQETQAKTYRNSLKTDASQKQRGSFESTLASKAVVERVLKW